MLFDPRTKQIIELFADPNSYSPLMQYDEVVKLNTNTVAKMYFDTMKEYNPHVEKKKYRDKQLNAIYEAWLIRINLKHSIIDAFFYSTGDKTRIVIVRKDRPYIIIALGAAIIVSIILLGRNMVSPNLQITHLLTDFITSATIMASTIYISEKLTLPHDVKEKIRKFDAEIMPYKPEYADKEELTRLQEETGETHISQ